MNLDGIDNKIITAINTNNAELLLEVMSEMSNGVAKLINPINDANAMFWVATLKTVIKGIKKVDKSAEHKANRLLDSMGAVTVILPMESDDNGCKTL